MESVPSSIRLVDTEHSVYTRHCSRLWRRGTEQKRQQPPPHGARVLVALRAPRLRSTWRWDGRAALELATWPGIEQSSVNICCSQCQAGSMTDIRTEDRIWLTGLSAEGSGLRESVGGKVQFWPCPWGRSCLTSHPQAAVVSPCAKIPALNQVTVI